MHKRLQGSDGEVNEMSFSSNTKNFKQEYLEIF